jgi:TrmH family RNA methyltransferase
MTITSHHNRKLKEIRKLRQRRRWRERSGRFVAEGEDLLAAADAAGWPAVERYCVAGSGLPGIEVEADLLASRRCGPRWGRCSPCRWRRSLT